MQSSESWKTIAMELEEVLGKTNYQNKKLQNNIKKKKTIEYAMTGGFILILLIALFFLFNKKTGIELVYEDCGCSNIDECLSIDSTQCARQILFYNQENSFFKKIGEKEQILLKIIVKEMAVNIKRGEFEKGWSMLKGEDLGIVYEHKLEECKLQFLTETVVHFLEVGDATSAQKWASRGTVSQKEILMSRIKENEK